MTTNQCLFFHGRIRRTFPVHTISRASRLGSSSPRLCPPPYLTHHIPRWNWTLPRWFFQSMWWYIPANAKVRNGAFYGITTWNHIISMAACLSSAFSHTCMRQPLEPAIGTFCMDFLLQNTLPKHVGFGITQLHLVVCRIWLGHYRDSNLEVSTPFSHQCMRVFVPLLSQSETALTSAPSRMDGKWSGISFLLASSSLVNHGG